MKPSGGRVRLGGIAIIGVAMLAVLAFAALSADDVPALRAHLRPDSGSAGHLPNAGYNGPPAGAQKLRLLSAYAKLPMTFESNQGQTAKQVKFVSHGPGYSLFLTPTEAVIALKRNSTESKPSAKS